jgi:hypothetical protein
MWPCARDVVLKDLTHRLKTFMQLSQEVRTSGLLTCRERCGGEENLRAWALGGASLDGSQQSVRNDEYSQPVSAVSASTRQILALMMLVHSRK